VKYIKTYSKYKESISIDLSMIDIDLNESLSLFYNSILNAVGAKEEDIFTTFNLPKSDYQDHLDIDYLSNNTEFINSLSSIGMKKSNPQNSDDFECFINKPCKFMFIYRIEANELENPSYIIFQLWNNTLGEWEEAKLYKINDEIKKFYDKLSSSTIEIKDNDKNYIYNTSNGGNEWILQNPGNENDIFKKYLRKDDLDQILSDKKLKINII
jgi:hypothetical protein